MRLPTSVRAVFHDTDRHSAEFISFASFGRHEIDVDLGRGQVCGGVFLGCHDAEILYAAWVR